MKQLDSIVIKIIPLLEWSKQIQCNQAQARHYAETGRVLAWLIGKKWFIIQGTPKPDRRLPFKSFEPEEIEWNGKEPLE